MARSSRGRGSRKYHQPRCCCGCCSCRTGTQIIAIVWLVFLVFDILNMIYGLILYVDGPQVLAKAFSIPGIPDTSYRGQLEEFLDHFRILTFVVLGVRLALAVINAILSMLLLFGACTNSVRSCVPWFYFNVFIFLIFLFIALSTIISGWVFLPFLAGLSLTISWVLVMLVFFYCLYVVYQYIKDLRYPHGQQAWLTKTGEFYALRKGEL